MSKKKDAKLERDFQASLIKEIKNTFEDCLVMKMDPSYIQGIPDLLVLFKDKWALLEVKRSKNARHRPNQDYYVDKLNGMSFSRFIFPENKDEVLKDLSIVFGGGAKHEI